MQGNFSITSCDGESGIICVCSTVRGVMENRGMGEIMNSIYDDLSEKLKKDPRLIKKGGARVDLSLLLFNARESFRELWLAADHEVAKARREGLRPSESLESAVEKLRPIFGERKG